MERTCTAITSNDKDAVMHLEIYAPEDKSNLKGMIQICHGMTEYVWRYKSFAEYFTSRGYIVFGNDIISHGRSNTSKSLGLYFNDWRNVYDDAEKTREYVQEKYPYLPVYILGFSLGSYVVRTMGSLLPYKKEILIGTGDQPEMLMKFMQKKISKKYAGKMAYISDDIGELLFGSYAKKFPGKPKNYWLLTDDEKRREYEEDRLVKTSVTPGFFCEFLKGMELASIHLKMPNNTIPTMFMYGENDPVSGFGKGIQKVYRKYKKWNPNTEIMSFPGTHDILHDAECERAFEEIYKFVES